MPDLKALEGHPIQAAIRFFNPEFPHKVREYKLHKIEDHGIWVENQEYTDKVCANLGVPATSHTFVAFVPWSEVTVIYRSVSGLALSEKEFGLHD